MLQRHSWRKIACCIFRDLLSQVGLKIFLSPQVDLGKYQKELDKRRWGSYYTRANAYLSLNKYEESAKDFTLSLQHDSLGNEKKGFTYYARGVSFLFIGKREEAIHDLTKTLEYDIRRITPHIYTPHDFYLKEGPLVVILSQRAECYSSLSRYEESLEDWNKIIELCGDKYPKPYHCRGVLHFDNDKFREAIKDFTKAIKLDPNYHQPLSYRGQCYHTLGVPKKALRDLNASIRTYPHYYYYFTCRGLVYESLRKHELGVEDFTVAINLLSTKKSEERSSKENCDLHVAYNYRASSYIELKRFHKSIEDATEGIESCNPYKHLRIVGNIPRFISIPDPWRIIISANTKKLSKIFRKQ